MIFICINYSIHLLIHLFDKHLLYAFYLAGTQTDVVIFLKDLIIY